MLSKGIWVIVILLISPILSAQTADEGFVVNTNPAGAEVSLKGDVIISGISPVSFWQGLIGQYQVKIKKFGYETYHSSVYLEPDRPMSLTVALNQKTRFKALARSALIPGWGQYYSDQKAKGGVFLAMTLTAIGAYFLTDDEYDYRIGIYENDLRDYRRENDYYRKQVLYDVLNDSRKKAYDAETERRIAIGAIAVIYGFNLVDLLFHFPEESGSFSIPSLTLSPDLESGGVKLTMSHNF